jgi:RNA polymerase sigma-70 factor (sigma-E family)
MEPERPVIRAEETGRALAAGGGGLAELYARHLGGAVGLAYLLTGDRHLAEDLAQEAFVRLAGRFGHLRNPDAFEAYLRRTVVNLFTSHLRRRRVERAYLRGEAGRPEVAAPEPDVGLADELWAALQRLPERQRAAVVLRFYEDLSERDVAAVLRCSVPAAKSLVARAMETLRGEIGSEER